jgi:hypothetical protein
MFTVDTPSTRGVGTLKFWNADPAATVTVVVENAGFDPDRVTTAPPAGAAPVSVTETFTFVPPTAELGETATAATVGRGAGSSVTEALPTADPSVRVAVTVTVCMVVTVAGAV